MNPFPTIPPGYCFINRGMDGGLGEKKKISNNNNNKVFGHFLEGWINLLLDHCASRVMWRCQGSFEVGGKAGETSWDKEFEVTLDGAAEGEVGMLGMLRMRSQEEK